MTQVTRPFLPPYVEYEAYLQGIWERNWLTNNGPLVQELEERLKQYLGMEHLLYVSNGTIALQIAIKALGLTGEIITTPFSYVATTSSIVWEGCTPIFVDIDPGTFNIDPEKIENAITPRTSAILATHVFGNPCDVETIADIARRRNLRVIYDGAHAFGTVFKGKSIFTYGDISTTSFHATKLFHTIEGGAVFAQDGDLIKRMAYMRNFGHDGPEKFNGVGINGKNSEFHAAMGLVNLKHFDAIVNRRRLLSEHYDNRLVNLNHMKQAISSKTTYNYSYYPILLPDDETVIRSVNQLNQHQIYPRRYFYPLLTTLPYIAVDQMFPVAQDIASRILCLPLYDGLSFEDIDFIAAVLLRVQEYGIA